MHMPENTGPIRLIIPGLLLAGVLVLAYLVLENFLVPLAWAAILAYVTWPLYRRLRTTLNGNASASALLMTGILIAALAAPVFWLATALRVELAAAYQFLSAQLAEGVRLPDALATLPWVGEHAQRLLEQLLADPAALRAQLAEWARAWGGQLLTVLGGAGRNALILAFTLLAVFFLYRDAEILVAQARSALARLLGHRGDLYLAAAADMMRAVVYGLVLTALAQGLLAGLGYWAAGLGAPVLLGIITALAALIPFGTPFVYVPAGIWLIATDHLSSGVGLLLWGTVVVSSVDNLIRPLVISRATRLPFLLVLFGVLGGVAAFGLVGLFLGPVILAVLVAVWREWLSATEVAKPARRARARRRR
jgi:predicted PurR-regulated permease PerM